MTGRALTLRPRAPAAILAVSLVGVGGAFTWPLVLGFSASDSGHSHYAPWVFLVMLPLLLPVVAAGGRVFGPGFGFVLGNVAMFASAALTGGGGPWLPFQMLAAGWVGLFAGCLPRLRGRAELAMLAGYDFAGVQHVHQPGLRHPTRRRDRARPPARRAPGAARAAPGGAAGRVRRGAGVRPVGFAVVEPVDLVSLGADVEWPDSEAGTALRESLTNQHELGHLAPLAEWWRSVRPRENFDRPRLIVVGRDVPNVVTAIADDIGASHRTVDPDGDLTAGAAIADAEIESGADLLMVAVPGTDADAATAVSALTNTEPVKVLARGAAATDPDAWMERAIAVRDARRACMAVRTEPDRLLAQIGSPRLAVAAGIVLRGAARRTPVLLDGPVAAAAALIAYEAQPRAVRWWAAADLGPDPMQELALTRMGQQGILGLGTGTGDGLAAVLAVPVIRAAALLGS